MKIDCTGNEGQTLSNMDNNDLAMQWYLTAICVGTSIGHAQDPSSSVMQCTINFVFKFSAVYAFTALASAYSMIRTMLPWLKLVCTFVASSWLMFTRASMSCCAQCSVYLAKLPVGSPACIMKSLMILCICRHAVIIPSHIKWVPA